MSNPEDKVPDPEIDQPEVPARAAAPDATTTVEEAAAPHRHDETPPQDVGATGVTRRGLPRLGMVAIIIGAVALSLGLMQNLSSTIAPLFLGLNLMIAAYPVYTGLKKIKAPSLVAAVVTMLTVFVVLILGIGAVAWSVTQVVTVLTQYSDQFVNLYNQTIGLLAQLGFDQEEMLKSLKSISPSSILDFAGGILSSTSAASGLIAVMIVGIVFMTMDLPSVQERLAIVHRQHPGLTDSISAVASGIRRYWVVTTVFGLIVALINGGVILVLGVSLPLVWVVLTFITNYIPQHRFRDRPRAPGAAGARGEGAGDRADRGDRLLGDQLHPAVPDPAQVHRRRRRHHPGRVVRLAAAVDMGVRRARRPDRAARDAHSQGPADRSRPEAALGQRVHQQRSEDGRGLSPFTPPANLATTCLGACN